MSRLKECWAVSTDIIVTFISLCLYFNIYFTLSDHITCRLMCWTDVSHHNKSLCCYRWLLTIEKNKKSFCMFVCYLTYKKNMDWMKCPQILLGIWNWIYQHFSAKCQKRLAVGQAHWKLFSQQFSSPFIIHIMSLWVIIDHNLVIDTIKLQQVWGFSFVVIHAFIIYSIDNCDFSLFSFARVWSYTRKKWADHFLSICQI